MAGEGRYAGAMSDFIRHAAMVFMGAGTGGVARFAVGEALREWMPRATSAFPWPTLLINVSGCLAIGLLAPVLKDDAKALVIVGILGGYTTFSAFGRETLELWTTGRSGAALAYVAASVTLGLAATALGSWWTTPRLGA
jgi:CrcB protein